MSKTLVYYSMFAYIFTYVKHIVSSAFTRANLILKCFNSRNVQILLRAFKVYVLPIIECASSVWSPHLVTDIRKVEIVQRKFPKPLPGCTHLSYPDRLVRLNLDVRRLRHDLILTYKIVFGLTDMNPEDFFNFANSKHNTRAMHTNSCLATAVLMYAKVVLQKG